MSREEADRLATIIQTTFRKYLNSKLEKEKAEEASVVSEILETAELPPEQEAKAAVIIQRAYRSFREKREKEKEMLIGMIDWRIAARSAIYLYRKTGVTPEEANRAATFIKSAYKGYYTRRVMTRLVEESQEYHAGDDYEEDGRWQEEEEGGMQEDDGRTQEEEVEVDVVAGEGDSFSIKEKNVRINYDTIIPRVDFDYEAKAVVTDDFSEDVVIHDDDTFEPVDSAAFVTSVMDNLLSSVFSDGGSEGRRRRRSYDVGSGLESVGEVIEEESET